MRGVKCSWKEMQRLHREVLPAIESGSLGKYAAMRCLSPNAISDAKAASRVMSVIDEMPEFAYANFEHFQPSHAREIARRFKKDRKKDWSDGTKAVIADWVHYCEENAVPVEKLRQQMMLNPLEIPGNAKTVEPERDETPARKVASFDELTGEIFGTVYADPPWQYGNQQTRSATDNHYETLPLADLCAMPVAKHVADDAHLHLWTTNGFLREAFEVMEKWGFEYKSCFVWCKPQMGIGNYWRVSHEFLLLGIRGNAKRFNVHDLMSWEAIDRGEHSAKPEKVRGMIERASPGPFLELFGRKPAVGWTVFGNQISEERRIFA